ncbi:MAG: ATP-binding protein [Ktedonobacteraceae bacterium]
MSSSKPTSASALEELERLRARVLELEQHERERTYTETALDERVRLSTLTHDVSVALIQSSTLQESLQQCAQSLVIHLGAAFARIWTLNPNNHVLELQASAGMYTHLDGSHSRVPVGTLKIGLIAAERLPHLTNAVIGDPRVSEQEWATREGMVAFAGYPLLIEEQVIGVMALFARAPLSTAVLDAMASVSNAIALGIERKRVEEEHAQLLVFEQMARTQAEAARTRTERILDNLTDGFMIFDEAWHYTYINPQATPFTGKPWQELLGKNVWEEFPALIDSIFYQQYHYAVAHQESVAFEVFSAMLSEWFDVRAYPIPGGLAIYFRNITQRKQAEEEHIRLLEAEQLAHAEAEAALQVRNDFLSSVTHDLKTPLAAIKGNIQLLQRRLRRGEVPDPAWLMERLAVIESSTVKMTGMIEDLLDVAKLQAGQQLDLDMRPLRLVPLVRQISTEQQETTKRHHIVILAPTEDLLVRGDLIRLDRVLTNLLNNAIKYSPKGGQITLELTQEEEQDQLWVALSIRDQGVGIPSADLPHIFEPFHRASNVAGHIQGTGIGLASVAQVIRQHGGSISVNSEEGQGSIFVLRLPYTHSEAAM